jgi:hypothetical protein
MRAKVAELTKAENDVGSHYQATIDEGKAG